MPLPPHLRLPHPEAKPSARAEREPMQRSHSQPRSECWLPAPPPRLAPVPPAVTLRTSPQPVRGPDPAPASACEAHVSSRQQTAGARGAALQQKAARDSHSTRSRTGPFRETLALAAAEHLERARERLRDGRPASAITAQGRQHPQRHSTAANHVHDDRYASGSVRPSQQRAEVSSLGSPYRQYAPRLQSRSPEALKHREQHGPLAGVSTFMPARRPAATRSPTRRSPSPRIRRSRCANWCR